MPTHDLKIGTVRLISVSKGKTDAVTLEIDGKRLELHCPPETADALHAEAEAKGDAAAQGWVLALRRAT